ncbi:hypothetical protein [Oceanobacillus timonensis]|uniref:hypothetical protein n=1 Tax=Oceanobacillus timonensis TaxID=1926285 RepID=UPI0009BAEF21|nr:hypothetical protein [Oceanobacillus timonensis]
MGTGLDKTLNKYLLMISLIVLVNMLNFIVASMLAQVILYSMSLLADHFSNNYTIIIVILSILLMLALLLAMLLTSIKATNYILKKFLKSDKSLRRKF